ncbi:MAG: glycosyltransferase family 9 protein, partial [Ignavibacteria bacterium]
MILNKNSIKKILLIKPRGIGDLILSTIVLKNIKSEINDCEIHYLTEKFAAPVLENNPFITRIHKFGNSLKDNIKLISQLRKENYDIIFDFYSNPRTAQFTFLTKATLKVGYGKRGRNYAYHIKIKIDDPDMHSALAHLEFLNAIGINVTSKEILYFISDEEKFFSDQYFSKNKLDKNCIGIIPGGGWASK